MDMRKYYDITHREHVVLNPTSEEKLGRLVHLLRLHSEAQVADIACGKGEFLIRLAEAYELRGVGIDISSYYISEAQKMLKARAPDADIEFREMGGADYKPDEPNSLDLASCIGASWIFGGHAGTLEALISMVRPGGWVVVGEPFWLQEPSPDYLGAVGIAEADLGSHLSNAEAGEQLGLELVHTLVSSRDDWDRYEGLQWYAMNDYTHSHPDDPDLKELVEQVDKEKAAYLRWGRDTLGWAIYLFRLPENRK